MPEVETIKRHRDIRLAVVTYEILLGTIDPNFNYEFFDKTATDSLS